jgi:hypothetical protein
MSRAPTAALLFAVALGSAVLDGAAGAPRTDGDAEAEPTSKTLFLSRAAIANAVRRTAVADPDLDGLVTSDEAAKFYQTRFRLLDENHDGAIDGSEFQGATAARSLQVLDGFSRPRPLAFESVDVDGDRVITPEEFLRAEVVRRSAGGLDARRQAIFEQVDSNQDGALSRQEFMAAGRREFGGSDGDGDGKITIWEFYSATRL